MRDTVLCANSIRHLTVRPSHDIKNVRCSHVRFKRMFKPSEVEELTGIKQENLRDWRRRGFTSFGTASENGRWTYSKRDLLMLCITSELLSRWFRLDQALYYSSECVPQVALWLELPETPFSGLEGSIPNDKLELLNPSGKQQYAVLDSGQPKTSQESHFKLVKDLRDAGDFPGVHAVIIDLEHLAKMVPSKIVKALTEVAE